MKYTALGRSGLQVSRIALGTMNFGPVIDEQASFQILDAAVEAGVNFIDTADVYAGPPWGDAPGGTEEIVGRWIAARQNRDALVVATKLYGVMGAGVNDRGLSARHIRAAVDASLRRLNIQHIDLIQMHHIDRSVPVDEVLDAFSVLRDQGKIIYLGSSNFAGWNLAQYTEVAVATGRPRLVAEQSLYNLAQRDVELEVLPAAAHYGLGILPWSPLAGGLLGGVLAKSDRGRSADVDGILRGRREQVGRYENLAARLGMSAATLGVAWLLHQTGVTAPIVGPRRLEHLTGAVEAVDVQLDQAVLDELDAIWPGPGGQAPEAYAW